MKKVITMFMVGLMLCVSMTVQAKTDLAHPYTWSEAQCIMFGLLGFVAVFVGILFLLAMVSFGIRTIREWFKI